MSYTAQHYQDVAAILAAEREQNGPSPDRRTAMITAYGPSKVAEWLGVSRSAVSNWPKRFGGWPVEPAVQIVSGSVVFPGWLPEQREAWLAWQDRPEPESRTQTGETATL